MSMNTIINLIIFTFFTILKLINALKEESSDIHVLHLIPFKIKNSNYIQSYFPIGPCKSTLHNFALKLHENCGRHVR